MIIPENFISYLIDKGVDCFTGIPDSTFKGLTTCFDNGDDSFKHINAANECDAMAIAAGYHLSTNSIPVVYMQNSGLGKVVNPYTSLAAKEVYSIPALLLIGWRGCPDTKDEPQHALMGQITEKLLETLKINYIILDESRWQEQLNEAILFCREKSQPFAIIVKKSLFAESSLKICSVEQSFPLRENILQVIVDTVPEDAVFVSTTGKTSRELYEIRDALGQSHESDFYTVGSMGCASSIALGVSLGKPSAKVYIIDGDGACLMQFGALATLGTHGKECNICHIIIDNGVHESTGGQKTLSANVSFADVANSCGYKNVARATTLSELKTVLEDFNSKEGLRLIVVDSKKGSRSDLGRPKTTPSENKLNFMKALQKDD
jgi:phosphonopyruvate decarboxylase